MRSSKFGWLAALALAAVVAACGGGGGDAAPVVVAQDTTVPVTKSSVTALSGTTVAFPAVPALGTTSTTTLQISVPVVTSTGSATTGTPTFNLQSGGNVATGDLAFGSCVFIIRTSTFPPESPLGLGKTITVNPCEIDVETGGTTATGGQQQVSSTIQLGNSRSVDVPLPVTINLQTGAITLPVPPALQALGLPASIPVGTVTLSPVTGAV